jgi:hypothetical protein
MDTTQGFARRASFGEVSQQLANGALAVQDVLAALKQPSLQGLNK